RAARPPQHRLDRRTVPRHRPCRLSGDGGPVAGQKAARRGQPAGVREARFSRKVGAPAHGELKPDRSRQETMDLKLACADFTLPLLPHDRSLDLIAMLGFEGVDIGLFEGRSHLWPSRVFPTLRESARELTRKLGDRGLKLADVFLQTAPDFVSL